MQKRDKGGSDYGVRFWVHNDLQVVETCWVQAMHATGQLGVCTLICVLWEIMDEWT